MCGECCKKIRVTSILSNSIRQHGGIEELKKYYSYRNITVAGYDDKNDLLYLELDTPCDKLDDQNRCVIHSDPTEKPYICHRYPWYRDDIDTCGYEVTQ